MQDGLVGFSGSSPSPCGSVDGSCCFVVGGGSVLLVALVVVAAADALNCSCVEKL